MVVLIFCSQFILGQEAAKKGYAKRTAEPIKIDGNLSESSWKEAIPLTDFKQNDPFYNNDVTFKTEVSILFDDDALYVGATMFDSSPDSLLLEMGNRDASLNADAFGIKLDTYNKQNDSYIFQVTASGVQTDVRDNDPNFNAVWESAVSINSDSWHVEMRIPYAAIRFPRTDKQVWRVQMYRNLRRKREISQWALEDKVASNKKAYWGELFGIENIKPPVRLSLTPYLTAQGEHYPYNIEEVSNYSKKMSGGIDLKLGLGESHTLDVTLLPDFSQVQSDNQVKNLSAFETVYDENRPFFQESVDLFNKGGLFYSRRIGRIPLNYESVNEQLGASEYIKSNPYQSKLINATKFSGRNKNGLAVGLFNAITESTYATIGDSIDGERRVLTDPLTNYNIVVFDKAFKNSSSVYLINTNVQRRSNFNNANVTGAGISLLNNKNTFSVDMSGAHSRIYDPQFKMLSNGNSYYVNVGKVKGNFLFNLWRNSIDDKFDKNDMGLMFINSQVDNGLNLNYNIYEPFSHFLNVKTRLSLENSNHYITHEQTSSYMELFSIATLRNYLTLWGAFYTDLTKCYDYYEPRIKGRYYVTPITSGFNANFSSDYRKTLALDGGYSLYKTYLYNSLNQSFNICPIVRVNNHLSFNHVAAFSINKNNVGFADIDSVNNVFFGKRNLQTIENTLSGLYIIKNDLSISLRARHYWVLGKYNSFYKLENDGNLTSSNTTDISQDFNFNSFNIDMVFNWQFAPGSNLSIIWKNALMQEDKQLIYNYIDNFTHTLAYPQLNTLTLKFLYYFDYVSVRRRLRSELK